MHCIKIEFSEKELNEIMEEIDQAQEKIFESWKTLVPETAEALARLISAKATSEIMTGNNPGKKNNERE